MASTPPQTKKGADESHSPEGGLLDVHGDIHKSSSHEHSLAKVIGDSLYRTVSQTLNGEDDRLGTEFIEYHRDLKQWEHEKDYATTFVPSNDGTNGDRDVSAGATRTSNRLLPFPLVIDAKSKTHPITGPGISRLKEIIGGSAGAKLEFRNRKGQNLADELVGDVPDKGKEIAIVVAGNSGLPGGGTSIMNSDPFPVRIDQIHNGHKTQEESVVANFYAHTSAKHAGGQFPSFNENDGAKNRAAELVVKLYKKTLQKKWGLKSCCRKNDYNTFQEVESYVHTKNPIDYADAWVVRNPQIGPESWQPLWHAVNEQGVVVDEAEANRSGVRTERVQDPTKVANADSIKKATARTLNRYAKENFNFFLAGLAAAVQAAVNAAIMEQLLYGKHLKTLIFNKLGGGLYWPHEVKGTYEDENQSGRGNMAGRSKRHTRK
eukprot:g1322.t1